MFYIYKTTNLLNSKYYVGVHSGPLGSYYGSGKALKWALKKYGLVNFSREIIDELQTIEEAYAREAEIVNKAFIDQVDTYNMCLGGKIPPSKKGVIRSEEAKEKTASFHRGRKRSIETRMKMSNAMKGKRNALGQTHMRGRKLSEETRKKISLAGMGRVPWNKGKICPTISYGILKAKSWQGLKDSKVVN